jgi:hypothetical protein
VESLGAGTVGGPPEAPTPLGAAVQLEGRLHLALEGIGVHLDLGTKANGLAVGDDERG